MGLTATRTANNEQRVYSGSQIAVSDHVVHVGVPQEADSNTPSLRIVRDGDVVTRIEISCTCGCSMSILCDYGSA